MKKLAAILMALTMLLSFAMAEEVEGQVAFNFADLGEEVTSAGRYVQLGGTNLKFWMPYDFEAKEIPQEDTYADVAALLAYTADPQLTAVITASETEVDYATLVSQLQADPDYFQELDLVKANGLNSVSYRYVDDDGVPCLRIIYMLDGYSINFIAPVTDGEASAMFQQLFGLMGASLSPIE